MGRPLKEDLAGKRMGRLTVVGRDADCPRHAVKWIAQCSCGNVVSVSGGNLRNGLTRSCGCLRSDSARNALLEKGNRTAESLVGQTFGSNVVVADIGGFPRKWLVRCKCGAERRLTRQSIRSARDCKACTASNRIGRTVKDVAGRTFGWLTVLGRHITTQKGVWWECRCKCGTDHVADTYSLTGGRVFSCGCAVLTKNVFKPLDVRLRKRVLATEARRTSLRVTIDRNMRARVRQSLHRRGLEKNRRWKDLFGYSLDDLVAHLMATIPHGFTERDALTGRLHIEHKRPLASFFYASMDDPAFLEAWSLDNLRFMSAKENLKKGVKWSADATAA